MQFDKKKQLAFLEDLTSLIEDGVPVSQAIETILEISSDIQTDVAESVSTALGEGKTLADGLQPWFSTAIVEIVRSSEHGGNLATALRSATNTLSNSSSNAAEVINALVYPLVIVSLALVLVVFIKSSVLSTFTEIKPMSQWPATGQNLYNFAAFVQTWWWIVLLIAGLLVAGLIYLLKQLTGAARHEIDNWPIISLYRRTQAAELMQTLGLFLSHGIVLKNALEIIHRHAPPYLAWHLTNMEQRLGDGNENLADVLDTQLIDKSDLARLKVVAKGKGFEHALKRLGTQSQEKNSKIIALVAKIAGGALLGLGAFIAVSVIFGIYAIGSSLAGGV